MSEDVVTETRTVLAELTADSKNFTDAHRYVIQSLIEKGSITKKQFYLTYLKYHVSVTLQRDVKCIASCEATESDIDDLIKTLLKVCNQKCQQIGFRIKLVTKESNEKQFVVICSERPFSNAMLVASGWKEDDHFCITSFIKHALQNEGKIERTWAREFSRKLPNPMLAKQVETLLNVLVKQKWFYWSECKTFLEMDVRLVAELEPLLRFQYSIPHCVYCNSATIDSQYCAACPGCQQKFHQRCFRKLIEASKGSINCLECAKPLTSDLLCQDKRVFLRHFQPNDEYTEESESQSQTLTESEGEQDAEMSVATSRRPVKRAADSSPDEYDEGEAASELSQMNVDDTTERRSSRRSSKQFSMSDKPDKSKLRRTERSSDKTVVATDSNGEDSDGAD